MTHFKRDPASKIDPDICQFFKYKGMFLKTKITLL